MTVRRLSGAAAWVAVLVGGIAVLRVAEFPVHDGVSAGFAAVRVAGLLVGVYLLAVSGLRLAVTALRAPRLAACADVVTLPPVRRLLDTLLGATVVLAVASGPAAAERTAGADDPPVLRHLDDVDQVDAADEAAVTHDARASAEAHGDTWNVEPGDHFWSIAERVLAQRLGRPPTEAETARYWLELIDANRSRLAHPDVPDLIYPEQTFVLPPT